MSPVITGSHSCLVKPKHGKQFSSELSSHDTQQLWILPALYNIKGNPIVLVFSSTTSVTSYSHKDTGNLTVATCDEIRGVKWVLEKQGNQQNTKKCIGHTSPTLTELSYKISQYATLVLIFMSVFCCCLYKIEGGARIGKYIPLIPEDKITKCLN